MRERDKTDGDESLPDGTCGSRAASCRGNCAPSSYAVQVIISTSRRRRISGIIAAGATMIPRPRNCSVPVKYDVCMSCLSTPFSPASLSRASYHPPTDANIPDSRLPFSQCFQLFRTSQRGNHRTILDSE